VFLESEFKDIVEHKAAEAEILEFFSNFSSRSGRKKAVATS
jgi:hypothetical protein